MPFFRHLKWETIRTWLLGVFILLFFIGAFIYIHTGKQIAPMQTEEPSANQENFGQFLVDHYTLLAPFFENNRQNLVTQGEPLLLKVMGDIILVNMMIGWVLAAGIGFGFATLYAPRHAKPQEAIIYATWRLGLDIATFLMVSFASFGWELLDLPIPVAFILLLFLVIYVIAQSILVTSVYGTTSAVSTIFYIVLLLILLLVGALITGSAIKKRVAIILSQFADVQAVTAQLQEATADANRKLDVATVACSDARQAVTDAQAKIDQIDQEQASLRKQIDIKQNSENYVYGRIIRIRAQGDLAGARDQIIAFLAKFPTGTLVGTAKAQLELINQAIADQESQRKQAEAAAKLAAEKARADLLARAAKGEATLVEVRHALLGKAPADVRGLFGAPTEEGPDRWGYGSQMVCNPQTNEKFGLSVYFNQGVVQSVDYYYGTGGGK